MRCSALCLLLCAALVSGAPSLLPGDPRYGDPSHAHDHGEHAHGEHAHDHGEHAHDGQAHPESHAHDGQAHPESHAHDGQAHPESHAHDGQAHPESHAHDEQAHPDKAHPGQAFPGQAFPGQAFAGQAFAGQAFPGQKFPGQAFPGQEFPGQTHPGQKQPSQASPEPESSLTKGIPDFPVSYVAAAPAVPVSAPQPSQPSNPFLSGSVQLPPSSSFQVAVKPVLPPAQRPTPEPIKEVNTNPLGGPAGPKGAVRASCPGPTSALPCVPDAECDPYTGFLKSDGIKLPYPITKDTPTVAIGQCILGAGVGVCCKRAPKSNPTAATTAVPIRVEPQPEPQAHASLQAHPGQAHPGQTQPGQASPEPESSLTKGIPDYSVSYASGDASAESSQSVAAAPAVPVSAPQPSQPSNPFLSGSVQLPPSSSFQVAVKPVLPPAQRPTPEPIKEVNTNPLGGPAGPKGAVRASCPGPTSALPCVPDAECDPYTGFLKSDGIKLPYPITKDTPTVAIDQCKLSSGIGVCCKRFPKPKPTTTTTAVPLGVDYGQGLEHLKRPPTAKPANPFLPNYRPTTY